jgi:hypothetical protein
LFLETIAIHWALVPNELPEKFFNKARWNFKSLPEIWTRTAGLTKVDARQVPSFVISIAWSRTLVKAGRGLLETLRRLEKYSGGLEKFWEALWRRVLPSA